MIIAIVIRNLLSTRSIRLHPPDLQLPRARRGEIDVLAVRRVIRLVFHSVTREPALSPTFDGHREEIRLAGMPLCERKALAVRSPGVEIATHSRVGYLLGSTAARRGQPKHLMGP